MNKNEIKCGKFNFSNINVQITMDSDFIKRYYEIINIDGQETYILITGKMKEKLDIILNPEDKGIIEFGNDYKTDKDIKTIDNYSDFTSTKPVKNMDDNFKIYSNYNKSEVEEELKMMIEMLKERIEDKYITGLILFLNVLMKQISSYNTIIEFLYLDKLLSTLRVRTANPNELDDAIGIYDSNKNEIVLSKEYAYMHELLHMASTRKDDKFGIIVGFRYREKNIGRGINEFATQFIANKLFNDRNGYFDDYDYQIIEKLVNIIGFPEFLKCFFETGLEGLFSELRFSSNRNFIRLVSLLDNYHNIRLDIRAPKTDIDYNGGEVCLEIMKEINQTLKSIEEDYKNTMQNKKAI